MRGAAQMIAYEITMGAAIMGVIMVFNTLDLQALDRAQGAYMLGGWLPKWGDICSAFGILFIFNRCHGRNQTHAF